MTAAVAMALHLLICGSSSASTIRQQGQRVVLLGLFLICGSSSTRVRQQGQRVVAAVARHGGIHRRAAKVTETKAEGAKDRIYSRRRFSRESIWGNACKQLTCAIESHFVEPMECCLCCACCNKLKQQSGNALVLRKWTTAYAHQRSRLQIFLPFFQLDDNFRAWLLPGEYFVSKMCICTSYSTRIKAHILLRISLSIKITQASLFQLSLRILSRRTFFQRASVARRG